MGTDAQKRVRPSAAFKKLVPNTSAKIAALCNIHLDMLNR